MCDETRTIMLGCLRKIGCVLHKNERRAEENQRIADEEKQRSSQPVQIVSTNARDLLSRMLLKLPFLKPPQPSSAPAQMKPLLPQDIVEQLTGTKNKFMEQFRVSQTSVSEVQATCFLDRSIRASTIRRSMMMSRL